MIPYLNKGSDPFSQTPNIAIIVGFRGVFRSEALFRSMKGIFTLTPNIPLTPNILYSNSLILIAGVPGNQPRSWLENPDNLIRTTLIQAEFSNRVNSD